MSRLARFAWAVLGYNVLVILWGAYVRATGSGAGCGAHWPLCNGEVLPRAPALATVIEFSHRLTSGVALLAVVALCWWVFRACRRGDPARWGAGLSLFFMLTEAAVGAGLVLFRLVADNASFARAMFMAAHLVNTFTLLAFLTLTAWWLSGGRRVSLAGHRRLVTGFALACSGVLLSGVSGAVAALGDTLFPASSLSEALWADLSTTSHVLIRLRVLHPVIAAITAFGLIFGAAAFARGRGPTAGRLGRALAALAGLQVALGLLNVILLAPVWLQIVHLLVADAVWIALILLAASALAVPEAVAVPAVPGRPRTVTPWPSPSRSADPG